MKDHAENDMESKFKSPEEGETILDDVDQYVSKNKLKPLCENQVYNCTRAQQVYVSSRDSGPVTSCFPQLTEITMAV